MPLYIKDAAVAELAKDLARRSRSSVTDLVRQALESERERVERAEAARDAEVRAIQERFRRDWPEGSSNHDFLYDQDGREIERRPLDTVRGANTLTLDASQRPAGLYYLILGVPGKRMLETQWIKGQ